MSTAAHLPPLAGLPLSIDPDVQLMVKLYDRLRLELNSALAENLTRLEGE